VGEPKARANPHERAAIPLDRPGTVRCTQRLRITPPASNVPSLPEQDRVQHIKMRTASVFETRSGSDLDVALRVETIPGDVIARLRGELLEERTLGTSVALPERMNSVDDEQR
jgi:hypothetical protein